MTPRASGLFFVASYVRDISIMVDRFPLAGETRMGSDAMESAGGKGSNQAIQAARWGAPVALIAALGSDAAGDVALSVWREEGVQPRGVVRHAGQSTGQACVIVDASGENRIVLAPGANRSLKPEHIDTVCADLQESGLVAATLETPIDTTLHAFRLAREVGAHTLLNAAPAPASAATLPDALWADLDILVANEVEAAVLCDRPLQTDPSVLGPLLAQRVQRYAVITLGAEGAMLWGRDATVLHCLAPSVPVIDTTGAGDAFIGAFAACWTRGGDAALALRHGVAAGSLACMGRGCVPAFASRAAIEAQVHTLDARES